nr:hypothetical protein [Micromonospora sp. DSM 115978]
LGRAKLARDLRLLFDAPALEAAPAVLGDAMDRTWRADVMAALSAVTAPPDAAARLAATAEEALRQRARDPREAFRPPRMPRRRRALPPGAAGRY